MNKEHQLTFLETLFTPLVSDAMDRLGIEGFVLPPSIQSISKDPNLRIAGYAFPCRVIPTDEYVEISKLLEMVDSIPRDSIVLVASDKDTDAALWGGLMSAGAKTRGARGAVVNGGVRDIAQIDSLDFPVFAQYKCIKDIRKRGYMAEYGVPISMFGIQIKPNDIIFGDANGVVVIPSECSESLFAELQKSLLGEQKTEAGLLAGLNAQDLFREHGTF